MTSRATTLEVGTIWRVSSALSLAVKVTGLTPSATPPDTEIDPSKTPGYLMEILTLFTSPATSVVGDTAISTTSAGTEYTGRGTSTRSTAPVSSCTTTGT